MTDGHCRSTITLLGRKVRCRLSPGHEKTGRRKLCVASLRLRLKEGKRVYEIVVIRWRRIQ